MFKFTSHYPPPVVSNCLRVATYYLEQQTMRAAHNSVTHTHDSGPARSPVYLSHPSREHNCTLKPIMIWHANCVMNLHCPETATAGSNGGKFCVTHLGPPELLHLCGGVLASPEQVCAAPRMAAHSRDSGFCALRELLCRGGGRLCEAGSLAPSAALLIEKI